ncbi:hypothetical protein IP364_07600 [Helicobacter winghamensis]|uniref:hypothetical protein n=1 Tax=Helicobacter winghamensis TaxID=157268 RepID=UPI00279A8A41
MFFLHRQNDLNNLNGRYGIEIDLRFNGNLVLNHDVLVDGQQYPYLKDKMQFLKDIPIICNIKESGLEEKVIDLFGDKLDYYFLDSQIPDILKLSKAGYQGKFIIRISDVEPYSEKLMEVSKPKYIWIDYSQFDNFKLEEYKKFILGITPKIENVVAILVSPELYNLSYVGLIKSISEILPKGFAICTKNPDFWSFYV